MKIFSSLILTFCIMLPLIATQEKIFTHSPKKSPIPFQKILRKSVQIPFLLPPSLFCVEIGIGGIIDSTCGATIKDIMGGSLCSLAFLTTGYYGIKSCLS